VTSTFDLFCPKSDHVTGTSCQIFVTILMCVHLWVLNYADIICRFRGPIARQPALPWQPFCAPLFGGRPHVSPSYELDRTTQYWVMIIIFIMLRPRHAIDVILLWWHSSSRCSQTHKKCLRRPFLTVHPCVIPRVLSNLFIKIHAPTLQ